MCIRDRRKALQASGWPGDRVLSSHEFQTRRAFGEVLDGFGRLDTPVSYTHLDVYKRQW